MNFRSTLLLLIIFVCFSCQEKTRQLPLAGTWELVSATAMENDSVYSTFDSSRQMIKILNETHFAFLNHALNGQEDSTASTFSAGGGTYTLLDSTYTEHLDYFADPAWENHTFEFTVKIENDTLTQKGIEKVAELGIDRIITEKYIRVKSN